MALEYKATSVNMYLQLILSHYMCSPFLQYADIFFNFSCPFIVKKLICSCVNVSEPAGQDLLALSATF